MGPADVAPSRFDATLRLVRSRAVAPATRLFRGSSPSPQLGDRDQRRLAEQLDACLEPHLGGVIARGRAAVVAELYRSLDDVGRRRFFELLVERCGVDQDAVSVAIADHERVRAAAGGPQATAELITADRALRNALQPGWDRLFRLFCSLDEGVKFTVDLRADLLGAAAADTAAALAPLDHDLRGVLEATFDVGLLELRRITWDTSASVLEKLIAYESVHEITSWADLKNRLEADRRCYAFFHPGMPDEPLIFVEVALVDGMAAYIAPLLDTTAPVADAAEADTAIFYSISSCQAGLAGVSLGDFLIKWVVSDLGAELPGLRRFATLSPIPGLCSWLVAGLARDPAAVVGLLSEAHRHELAALADGGPAAALSRLVDTPDWVDDVAVVEVARGPLLRLAAHYLVQAKRGERARDRVANFHLTNGARVERLDWLGNPSPVGMAESLGIMVNYRYEPGRIEVNHSDYVVRGRISTSGAVTRLLN